MTKREQMTELIRKRYGLDSPKVLSAMLDTPREKFALQKYKDIAYADSPVPIGHNQTMSQPYTVAFMTHLLNLSGHEKVLEVGTGSGYQAAILSKLAKEVYTVEIIDKLAKRAKKTLKKLGFKNVWVKSGSGEWGWEEHAPYDAIMVTAGIENKVPKPLFDQLKGNGILVAPVGRGYDKRIFKYIKKPGGRILKKRFGVFHFVPFVREGN
jgi:protein-L-isoaspartate(D-aspartate) O-methyltransferase